MKAIVAAIAVSSAIAAASPARSPVRPPLDRTEKQGASPRGAMIEVTPAGLVPPPPVMGEVYMPSSRIIFVRRCPIAGCVVKFGPADDSRSDISQISDGDRVIGAFTQGDAVWNAMMDCIKATYAPFDI